MNSLTYGLPKKILCNKMNKENAVSPKKPNIPHNISKVEAFFSIKKMKQ